jgi:hypothetical protein
MQRASNLLVDFDNSPAMSPLSNILKPTAYLGHDWTIPLQGSDLPKWEGEEPKIRLRWVISLRLIANRSRF